MVYSTHVVRCVRVHVFMYVCTRKKKIECKRQKQKNDRKKRGKSERGK